MIGIRSTLATAALLATVPGVVSPRAAGGPSAGEPAPGPRGRGDTFLPTSPPPSPRVLTVSLAGLKADERIALTCLQGLLARERPRLWLVRNAEDAFWMEWHRSRGFVEAFQAVTNWPDLFRESGGVIRGAIIPDDRIFRGDLLAVSVAACEDGIVCSPQLAARLGLAVRMDLRGRFATYAEGLDWVRTTYRDRLNPHVCDFRHPGLLPFATFDYGYQWRANMFWVAGPREEDKPGVDRKAERRVVERILSELPPGGVCVGFPAHGEGEGLGEPPGVELLSRHGMALVCNNHGGNYSILSGYRVDRIHPRPGPPAPALERDKIYIALVLSDGDNQILWPRFFRRYVGHPAYGTFPLAFGIGPAIRELQPGLAQWYFENAASNTEFICDVSGAGYVQPDHFAEACADREAAWDGFLQWTRRLMEPMGLRSIRTVGGDDGVAARYAAALPFCHSLFADMGRYSGRSGIAKLTYTLPGGMPVFRAVTSWRYGKEGFLREVRDQVGARRPAFVNGFVHCWTFTMDDLVRIHAGRDPDMVFVSPSQLAALYREAVPIGTEKRP